jgi:hypothetical protein
MRSFIRVGAGLALLLLRSASASAEWQIKPFAGGTYGGNSNFVIVGTAPETPNNPHFVYGASGLLIGEVFGIEADFGHTRGFFPSSTVPTVPQITSSGVYTVTGNIVLAMPRHLTQYTLRPYIVGGAGIMHIAFDTEFNVFQVSERLQTMDLGAGVTGFITRRVGISWDVRYFRSIDRTIENGYSFGSEHLTFWRASMAVAVRL